MIDLNPQLQLATSNLAAQSPQQKSGVDLSRSFDRQLVKREELKAAAEQLVSTAFIQPLLAQMRDDPFKVDMFHGGRGEQIFGQQLDTLISERVTSSANFPVVDSIVNSFMPAQQSGREVDRRG